MTARARIRDTAMRMFADRGFDGTSIRAIAGEAGVSIGLIQHHFGSKAGLRDTCDDLAVGTMLEAARSGSGEGAPFSSTVGAGVDAAMLKYLARALIDGSPAAEKLFDSGAELAEQWLATTWPDRYGNGPEGAARVRAAAAVMAGMHLGPIALHVHLSRRLQLDVLDKDHVERIPTAMTDIYAAMGTVVGEQGTDRAQAPSGDPS